MMATAENIFREAALLQLTATCWQLDKKLPQSMLSEVGNVDYLKGRKIILPPESTCRIKQVIGNARNYLRRLALPFPITGCCLVPKRLIPEIQDNLRQLEWQFNRQVDDFLYWYPNFIREAQESMGELFDELDYPDAEKVKKRFNFGWRYITVGPSASRVLPPSIYKEEAQKFQNLMEQARVEAIASLREEFAALVAHMTDKLSGSDDGKPKRLRDSAVENLQDFLDSFANRNLFEDDQLETLVSQCRNIISGAKPTDIRSSVQLKQNLHDSMTELLASIDNSFENMPVRKLRLPEKKAA